MKNINIGRVDSNWAPVAAARYYAQRVDGGEYAFGATPADALASLEKREAASTSKFDKDLADEIAFLALGAAETLKNHNGTKLDAFGGYMGFIAEVTRHAPMLIERWKRIEANGFDGVWLYDVSERFGREWADELLNGTDESPAERLECIISDELERWL